LLVSFFYFFFFCDNFFFTTLVLTDPIAPIFRPLGLFLSDRAQFLEMDMTSFFFNIRVVAL